MTTRQSRLIPTVIIALAASCATLRSMPELPVAAAPAATTAALTMIGPHGRVDPRVRAVVTGRLAELGADNLLGRHLAVIEATAHAPLVAGNRVRLLVDGPRAYAAMFGAIAAARDHINVEMFIFDEAEFGGRRLSDLLVQKAAEGVAINVLYDSLGSSDTPPAMLTKLRTAGVRVCEFNPLNPAASKTLRFTQRDHRKVVVVDAHRAFAGGINFSPTYSSGSRVRHANPADAIATGWRDTHIELEGPASLEVQRLFLQSWDKQHCPAAKPADYLPAPRDAGSTLLRLNANSTDSRRNETYTSALSAITFATKSVDLTMAYFAPDDQLEDALRNAAQRGVQVRLLLAGFSDFGGTVYAGRARYSRLLDAGVWIFESRQTLLHAKTLEVDGIWSTVGSANWDWLSFANNDELNIVVIDEGFAAEMRAMFAGDLAGATPIVATAWRRRSLKERMLEMFWGTWERYL